MRVMGSGCWVLANLQPVLSVGQHPSPSTQHPLRCCFSCYWPFRVPQRRTARAGDRRSLRRSGHTGVAPGHPAAVAGSGHGQARRSARNRAAPPPLYEGSRARRRRRLDRRPPAAELRRDCRLKEVERRALTLPSQGVASTYDQLNVHTEPNRLSPSFLQVKEGEKVDVVAHVSAPRTPPERKPLIPPKPKSTAARAQADRIEIPAPALPPAPPPPSNWKELSRTPPEVQQDDRRQPRGERGSPGRLEPGAQCQGRERMGSQPQALHGHSRRGGAVCRRPSHHLVFRALGRAGRRRGEAQLAVDHHPQRRPSVRFRQLPRVHLEPAAPPL